MVFANFAKKRQLSMKSSVQKSVKEFTLETVRNADYLEGRLGNIVTDSFALVTNPGDFIGSFLTPNAIYRVGESRLVIITSGSAHVTINMEERHIEAGDVLLEEIGAIIEPHEISPDFNIFALAFKQPIANFRPLYVHPNESDWEEILDIAHLLHRVAAREPFRPEIVTHLLHALVTVVLASETTLKQSRAIPPSRSQQIFDDFRKLVSIHAATERRLTYYADRMCLSPHYLSEVVKRVSLQPPSLWINRAAITHARLLLYTHPEITIADVAATLKFPSSTVFCKFFRRLTHTSPAHYRRTWRTSVLSEH